MIATRGKKDLSFYGQLYFCLQLGKQFWLLSMDTVFAECKVSGTFVNLWLEARGKRDGCLTFGFLCIVLSKGAHLDPSVLMTLWIFCILRWTRGSLHTPRMWLGSS